MSFFSKVLQSFVVQIITLICGILSSVVTARYLGPQGRGILTVVQTVVFMSTYFGNLGIHAAIIYYGAQADSERTQKIVSTAMSIGLMVGALLMGVLMVLALVQPAFFENVPTEFMMMACVQIIPVLLTYFLLHLFIAKDHIKTMNVFIFIQALSNLILPAVLFLLFHLDLQAFIIGQTVLSVTLVAGLMIYSSRRLGFSMSISFQSRVAKEMITYGLVSFLVGLMGALVMRSNVFFINYFLGAGPTGIFAVASRYGEMMAILPGQLGLLLMPRISANQGDNRSTPQISRILVLILVAACILGFFLIGPVTNILFGEKFLDATAPAIVLLIGFAFLSMEVVYANYIAGIGLPRFLIAIWIPPLVVGVALNLFLIPRMGLNGAALAMTVTYGILFVSVLFYVSKLSGVPIKKYLIPTLDDVRFIRAKLFFRSMK